MYSSSKRALKLTFVLVSFLFSALLYATPPANTQQALFHCKAIDFDPTTASPEFEHWYPIKGITNAGSVWIRGQLTSFDAAMQYHNLLLDQSLHKEILSGPNYNDVLQRCTEYVESHSSFIEEQGTCDITLDGKTTNGTVNTIAGEFRDPPDGRPATFQERINGANGYIFQYGFTYQKIYWQRAACTQPGYGTGAPVYIYPLPFIITYDANEEKDCDDGCPQDNGVDAFSGQINNSIPALPQKESTSYSSGVFHTLQDYFPLDFTYSTNTTTETENITDVSGQWVNQLDIRMNTGFVSPYKDENWQAVNFLKEVSNIQIWRKGKLSSSFDYYDYDINNPQWVSRVGKYQEKLTGGQQLNSENSDFILSKANLDKEYFSKGQLTKIKKADGTVVKINHLSKVSSTFSVSKGPVPSVQGSITTIYDDTGYFYDVTLGSALFRHRFDNNKRLLYIEKPKNKKGIHPRINYHYDDERNSSLLTSVTNELGKTTLTYQYDDKGRVVETSDGSDYGVTSVNYKNDNQREVTGKTGKVELFDFVMGKIAKVECLTCLNESVKTQIIDFDKQYVDVNGTVTLQEKDYGTGLLSSVTVDAEGLEPDITEYSWKYKKPLLSEINNNGIYTRFNYDENDWLTETSIGSRQTAQYSYNEYGNITKVDGPRVDVSDITLLTYNNQGLVTEIKNALYQPQLVVSAYDDMGRITQYKELDNHSVSMSYTNTGQVSLWDNGITQLNYDYYLNGQLKSVTDNQGITSSYTYDDNQNLNTIEVNATDKIKYQRDSAGRVIATQLINENNTVVYNQSNRYDVDGNIASVSDFGVENTFTYDAKGNALTNLDANQQAINYQYDGLNRLTQTQDQNGYTTLYDYTITGKLAAVTDATGKVTQYTYNDIDELITRTSPDSGITHYEYDEAGNLISSTDARNITVNIEYDALNRPIAIRYPTPQEQVLFTYDEATGSNNGTGHLTSVTEHSGTTGFKYNQFAQLTETSWSNNQVQFALGFDYGDSDRLQRLHYPSGNSVSYSYDTLGNIQSVELTTTKGVTQIASGIQYLPFGPMTLAELGNGLTLQKTFDTAYRVTSQQVTGVNHINYIYDLVGNISDITDQEQPQLSRHYTYTHVGQLALDSWAAREFEYDGIGNRLTHTQGDTPNVNYVYADTEHRLLAVNTQSPLLFTYDARGNAISRGEMTLNYNDANRLESVTNNGSTTHYQYNYKGLRVQKTVAGNNRYYFYDENGLLISEANSSGQITKEYIYLQGEPLAMVKAGAIYYFHNSHLGAPQRLTDEYKQTVWQAQYNAFGTTQVNTQQAIAEQITNNIRFPGQYFDAETGLYYNWHRYYDPEIGRYLQSDPIGLAGGINTYGYVGGNPMMYIDPYGLFSMDPVWDAVYQGTGGWTPDPSTVNFIAGFGDSISFNLTKQFRQSQGICNVDYDSSSYSYGNTSGTILGLANAGRTGFQVYKGLSNARKWRANSRTARKTRARKIAAAGSYRPSAADATLTLIGGSGVDSFASLGSENNEAGRCSCEN
ncbi:MAG: RHS repeat-associated core domain-containing protein [Pseudoalteromonas sp.]|uniref:RHS repeat-associated core domain-containing protein n=1 Tax=unclassified Pseudoalteromonas TaxID=194690 RepID=UPI003F9E0F8F